MKPQCNFRQVSVQMTLVGLSVKLVYRNICPFFVQGLRPNESLYHYQFCFLIRIRCITYIVNWESEGHYCFSKMFLWEPEGHYRCTKSMEIAPFWFSMEHHWTRLMPFWLTTKKCRLKPGGGGGGVEWGQGQEIHVWYAICAVCDCGVLLCYTYRAISCYYGRTIQDLQVACVIHVGLCLAWSAFINQPE